MKPATEPAYPEQALTDPTVEAIWWNDVLAWGRTEHGKVKRICEWAEVLGKERQQVLPEGWCR